MRTVHLTTVATFDLPTSEYRCFCGKMQKDPEGVDTSTHLLRLQKIYQNDTEFKLCEKCVFFIEEHSKHNLNIWDYDFNFQEYRNV
jgi:hypothetical protein